MAETVNRKRYLFDCPGNYCIRVQGFLDANWSDRLAGLRITTCHTEAQDPISQLVGQVRDQAELAGVLNTLYDLNLTLLTVECLDADLATEFAGRNAEGGSPADEEEIPKTINLQT